MTVRNPRSRMISIRLSEGEYCALRQLCASSGARSVSDLARDAMGKLLGGTKQEDLNVLCSRMDEFRAQIRSLDDKMIRLAADFSSLTRGMAPHNNGNGKQRQMSVEQED